MSDTGRDRSGRNVDIPADAPEADALEQARPWGDDEEEDLPDSIAPDEPEADALDQARRADLGDEDEEPA